LGQMQLYKYDKIIGIEDSIVKKLRKGKTIAAKILILRYNMILNRLRADEPTEIPLYRIKGYTNITDNSYILDYKLECGFCGKECGKFSTSESFTDKVRNIRCCESEICKLKTKRYLYFKNGWIVPESKQKGLLKWLSGSISGLVSSVSNLF